MVTTIHLAHMPPDSALHVAMFIEVSNAPFWKEQLLAGSSDFYHAFVDAGMVVSTEYALAVLIAGKSGVILIGARGLTTLGTRLMTISLQVNPDHV